MFIKIALKAMALTLFLCAALPLTAQNCEQHQALLEKMDKGMMEKDVALMDDIYHADAVRHTPEGKVEGLAKIKEQAAQFYQDVPDAKGENLDVICTDDYLVTRWLGQGTPQGAPQMVRVTGITISKVKDGKIAEEWEEMNTMSLMMQLGYELQPPGASKN